MEGTLSNFAIRFALYLIFGLYTNNVAAGPASKRINSSLIKKFYTQNPSPVWDNPGNGYKFLSIFRQILDSCYASGLNKYDYHYNEIVSQLARSSEVQSQTDDSMQFTDAILAYFNDLYLGNNIHSMIGYDEISPKHTQEDDSFIINQLSGITKGEDFLELAVRLNNYTHFTNLYSDQIFQQHQQGDQLKIRQLNTSLNILRWISHFELKRFIVVNIPSAMLGYYEDNEAKLMMKVVTGKPATKTPRFAAFCNEVVFYPYWHVPHSIAVKEILPLCKKNYSILNIMNLQVINSSGSVLNPRLINWNKLNASNFPYTFRQSTGCDNALGVIKFNLTDPYNVYLHDTNLKRLFNSDHRYYSHGCIRVEKPLQLAGYLLDKPVDSSFLQACIKNQKPVENRIADPVPVFVVYMTACINSNNEIEYYKDIYNLFK